MEKSNSGVCRPKRRGGKRLAPKKRNCKIWTKVVAVLAGIAIGMGAVAAKIEVQALEYTYIHTELATQTDINVLFEEDQSDDWITVRALEKLHLPESYFAQDVDWQTMEYYDALAEGIYREGDREELEVLPAWTEIEPDYLGLPGEAMEQARAARNCYIKGNGNSNLYQVGRALHDVVMEGKGNISLDMLLQISADSMEALELFLTYKDRVINSEGPDIISATDIALFNGKLCIKLAVYVDAGDEKYRGYTNSLLAQGYAIFKRGLEQSTEDDKKYALISYYVGVSGERLLKTLPEGTPLYTEIGKTAMEGYVQAEALLRAKPKFYRAEENMDKHIKGGKQTLTDLGIAS